MKKNLLRNNKGISMIALIITILVMLILAVVVFAIASGEEGVVNKAESAKIKQIKAKIEEVTDIASNAVLFEDDNLKKYNDNYWESLSKEEQEEQLEEVKTMFDGDPSLLFLGKMNMQKVHQEVSNMLKNEIENNEIKVDGYFHMNAMIESLEEDHPELANKTNIEKYVYLYDIIMECWNTENENVNMKSLGFLYKILFLDQYIVTIEYEDETWEIASNGKGLIPEYTANDFEFDSSDRVIGYKGNKTDVTLPTVYLTRYVNEIGKRSTTGYRDPSESYFYNENHWSPFADKEMRMTGLIVSEGQMPINISTVETWAAMLTASPDEGGVGLSLVTKRENYQDDDTYRAALYREMLGIIKGKEYDSDGDGVKDDVEFYMNPYTGKFLDGSTQTVEIIRVPEIKDDMKDYTIYPYALAGDSKLKHVYLPASLFERNNGKIKYNSETIGYDAFEGSHPDLVIHIETPKGWIEEDCKTAENTIRGLSYAKEDGYTISWE